MKYAKQCSNCGHRITAYSHHLNKPLVSALAQMVERYQDLRRCLNLQKDLNLTKNQYNNFQKLQYWNLVKRTEQGWYPTALGIEFTLGQKKIYDKVATFGKEILWYGHDFWKKAKKKPQLVAIWDIDMSFYKKRPEYQEEKSNKLKLFQ